ncbi:MAG: molybdopterin-dependent oxidoreductase [Opitutales bacterium]
MAVSVNGQSVTLDVHPARTLLTALRDAGLTAARYGCGTGDCGCCTVLMDGHPVHACVTPAFRAEGRALTLPDRLETAPDAFARCQAFQCGYCTAGFMATAEHWAKADACPKEAGEAFKGNLCRCTGYDAIRGALARLRPAPGVGQPEPDPDAGRAGVGAPVPNRHTRAIVESAPRFTVDFFPEDCLFGAAVRSPVAHGEILSIDDGEALEIPGVVRVFTWKDVSRVPFTTACHPDPVGDCLDHYLLDNKVRFIGDRVAFVVAETREAAQRGARAVHVQYRPLTPVFTPEEAMADGAPTVHGESESSQIADPERNIAAVRHAVVGDIEAALAGAPVTHEAVYRTHRVQTAHLEPQVTLASRDADDRLHILTSTQVPFLCRRNISRRLGIPESAIHVKKAAVGGGFGNKQEVFTEDLCALAAWNLGRPVAWELSREEVFSATSVRHPMTIRVRAGADDQGNLLALDVDVTADTGAYGNHSQDILHCGAFEALAPYRCGDKRFRARTVYTNHVPSGAFRGYGGTQVVFAVESHLDELARKTHQSGLRFLRNNVVRYGDPLLVDGALPGPYVIGSYALDQCFRSVETALKKARGFRAKGHRAWRYGEGVALSALTSGPAASCRSAVTLSMPGADRAVIRTGAADIGTGSDTALCQIAADVLDLPQRGITLVAADTDETPFDTGAYASAQLYHAGEAVRRAATILKRRREEGRSFPMEASAEYSAEPVTVSFGVQGMRLAVDPDTGEIVILKNVQAIDAGRIINPITARGQVVGGNAMGLGYALTENLVTDDFGKLLNPGFRFYRLPQLGHFPDMEVVFHETDDPYGPAGARGLGEVSINCVVPALANALQDALGHRFTELPLTPDRVWVALHPEESAEIDPYALLELKPRQSPREY